MQGFFFFIQKHHKIFIILIIVTIFVNVGLSIGKYKSKYFLFTYWQRYPQLRQIYLGSQYVNKHPEGWIPDEVIDAYNAGALIKGENPVLTVPDTPPLGKYLIGLSIYLFNNENITTVICGFGSLFMMFLIGKRIYGSTLLALLPPLFFSFEPIFANQFIYSPLFDIIQLLFLLLSFYFFNKGYNNKKVLVNFLLATIFLGCFISTKFFITGLTIIAAWFCVLFFNKEKKKIIYLSSLLPIAVIVLLVSYIKVFAFGYSFRELLGVQKWIFLYHKSQLILPFSIWPLLLLNKWYVWFGNTPIISDPQWRITWPLITLGSLLTIGFYLLQKIKRNKDVEVLMAWVIFYLLFFSFGQITARYFVILLPILYMIAIFGLTSLIRYLIKKHTV